MECNCLKCSSLNGPRTWQRLLCWSISRSVFVSILSLFYLFRLLIHRPFFYSSIHSSTYPSVYIHPSIRPSNYTQLSPSINTIMYFSVIINQSYLEVLFTSTSFNQVVRTTPRFLSQGNMLQNPLHNCVITLTTTIITMAM